MRGVNGDAERIKGAVRFETRIKMLADGGFVSLVTQTAPPVLPGDGEHLVVNKANAVTFLISAATSYKSFQDVSGDPTAIVKMQIAAACKNSFTKLLAAHTKEHQRLFRRVTMDLGTSDAMRLPTNECIQNFGQSHDPQFAALYFHHGRYLLLSSSRPGLQPAGLQGIWNDSMNPPWGGKYTININT
jgi:alpha-L-fucosidase 2